MLIINADDYGRNRSATDRIMVAFRHGAVTSTSAMVFMHDSQRAAELAKESGLDTGLHLNFTEPFDRADRTPRAADQQEQIARFLTRNKFTQLLYHPGLRKQFHYVFQVQLEEFLRLFGNPPSHFDGHHHMHLCSNMMLGRVIPAGQKIRRSFSFFPGQKSPVNRVYRWLVDTLLKRQYRSTDFLFALPDCIRFQGFSQITAVAERANVELETHPERTVESRWLLSEACRQLRESVKTGSYSLL
jgi:chitin disaccharide deacetylase